MSLTAAIQTCGYLATVWFALLLFPQIFLNRGRRSTESLSLTILPSLPPSFPPSLPPSLQRMSLAAAIQTCGYLDTVCFALLLFSQIFLNQARRSIESLSLTLPPSLPPSLQKMSLTAAIQTCGYLATVCFALLLFPQIFLNQARRSTKGLSLSLVLLWHAAAVLIMPYLLYLDEALPLLLQWGVFALASVLLEVQFFMFRKREEGKEGGKEEGEEEEAGEATAVVADEEEGDEEDGHNPPIPSIPPSSFSPPPSPTPPLPLLLLLGLALLLLSLGCIFGLLSLFNAVSSSQEGTVFIKVVGSGLASLFLAVGFLPQLYLMCKARSSQGLSLGLSVLDLMGSSFSILVLCLEAKEEGEEVDVGGVAPYGVIVGFQVRREGGREGGVVCVCCSEAPFPSTSSWFI